MRTSIGARVFKTALAVLISVLLSERIGLTPVFVSTSAFLSMKPSVGLSWNNVKEQLGMQIIAFSCSLLFGLLIGPGPIAMFIAVIVIFQTAIHFKWTNNMNMGIVSTLIILSAPASDFLNQVLMRAAGILLGVFVGFVINVFIAPPEYRSSLVAHGLEFENLLIRSFQEAIHAYINKNPVDSDQRQSRKQEFKHLYNGINKDFNLYKNDRFPLFDLGNSEEMDLEIQFFHDYRDYLKGISSRIKDIWFWTDEQDKRREEWQDEEISPEFMPVIAVLRDALDTVMQKDSILQDKVRGKTVVPTEEALIWGPMDAALQSWQSVCEHRRHDIHQLTEVSIITQKMQWVISTAENLASDSTGG
jgi:hypothetical protein